MFEKWKKQNIWIISAIIFIVCFLLLPQNTWAVSLSSLSDRLTRQAPSTAADHEIKFTTPSGIGDVGQYLRLSFDSGFNLSAIDFSDIDVFHGPVSGGENSLLLAALPTSTAWGVNVAGSQITFTHPTNAVNGDIGANDKVIIRIGVNAGGTSQIINPATIGSKIIAISGNYGDSGKLATAIFDDQIGVGGQTINALPTPVTLNLPTNITNSSMHLSWAQNNDFDFNHYEFYYRTQAGVTKLNGTLIISTSDRSATSYTLSGLSLASDYYFVVYVYDNDGNSLPSNQVAGSTLSPSVTPPPEPPPPPQNPDIVDPDPFIEEDLFEKIGDVVCEEGRCAYFSDDVLLSGKRPYDSWIIINGSNAGVIYPTYTSWEYQSALKYGENIFEIYAMDHWGQISNYVLVIVKRYKVGDSNGDSIVDDFDLSTLVAHFGGSWCFSDFNMDNIVDDFDLSALASYWDSIY